MDRQEQIFPRLNDAQLSRISSIGQRRSVRAGEVRFEAGDQHTDMYVVISGGIDLVRPVAGREESVTVLGPGQFTGEINMLSSRVAWARGRVAADGSIIALDRDGVRAVVQRDPELSEILLRAFILRRTALISQTDNDLVLLGSQHSLSTLKLKEFLTRNGEPFTYHDVETEPGMQALLDRLQVGINEVPVLVCDGEIVQARTIVIATGVRYRRLDVPALSRFEGAGIFYSATHMEAQLCTDGEIAIVGGGNSAGQAAVFLSGFAPRVHVVVRGPSLAESMSRYLIQRIESSRNVELRTRTRIESLEGEDRLERVRWRHVETGAVETRPIRNLFVMTGADPNTSWLRGCLVLDDKNFVKTGADLRADELMEARWPLSRPPHLTETSIPGVFAVGDVRSSSVKRVASAVGEGSICVQLIHKALQEL